MEDTKQGEGNETPQTTPPTLDVPLTRGADESSEDYMARLKAAGQTVEEPQLDEKKNEPEKTPEPPVENKEVVSEEAPEVKSEPETITVDKRAIEFLERNLGHEALRHFKENFLK